MKKLKILLDILEDEDVDIHLCFSQKSVKEKQIWRHEPHNIDCTSGRELSSRARGEADHAEKNQFQMNIFLLTAPKTNRLL